MTLCEIIKPDRHQRRRKEKIQLTTDKAHRLINSITNLFPQDLVLPSTMSSVRPVFDHELRSARAHGRGQTEWREQ